MIKITDPNIIQKRERELIDAITGSLDRDALVDALKEQHRLQTISGLESRHGDIVAVGDMIAYRLDFDVRTVLSILFDRSGNYVEVPSSRKLSPPPETGSNEAPLPPSAPAEIERMGQEDRPDSQGDDAGEYLTLDQILTTRSEMITDSQPTLDKEPPPQPKPVERMTQMASDLADMISDINATRTR